MKSIFLTSVIVLFSCALYSGSVCAQRPAEPTKAEKEAAKKAEKEAKDARDQRLKAMEISLKELALFPQTYVGSTRRVKRALLGEIKPYTDDGKTIYFLAIKQDETSLWNFPNPDTVAFATDESSARQIALYYDSNKDVWRDWYPASVIFDTVKLDAPNGRTYYFARIKCVEFLGLFRGKWETVGDCS